MIRNREVAQEAINLVTDAKDTLLKSMMLVESTCGSREYAAYKKAIGRVVSTMLDEIVTPLYEQNPLIKPEGWDG